MRAKPILVASLSERCVSEAMIRQMKPFDGRWVDLIYKNGWFVDFYRPENKIRVTQYEGPDIIHYQDSIRVYFRGFFANLPGIHYPPFHLGTYVVNMIMTKKHYKRTTDQSEVTLYLKPNVSE